jgi:hypothetical protein
MMPLLQPMEKEINGKKFILSKFPAIAGREIAAIYTDGVLNKSNDYSLSEATMLKLMCYVGVPMPNGVPLPLTTRELVNNHTVDWETLVALEKEMMEYNCSFFKQGRA